MAMVHADRLKVQRMDRAKVAGIKQEESLEAASHRLKCLLETQFPSVGDLSKHPITPAMEKLEIRSDEVTWTEPSNNGNRTEYAMDNTSDYRVVQEQLERFVRQGYLREVSNQEKGLPKVQYSDNILVGGADIAEVFRNAQLVFERFETYGIKVDLRKLQWLQTDLTFLGLEVSHGVVHLNTFLQEKGGVPERICNSRDLERAIGILSYCRKMVPRIEQVLAPLRSALKEVKKGPGDWDDWTSRSTQMVRDAFMAATSSAVALSLPGRAACKYVLETDWSGKFSGFLLFAKSLDGSMHLMDIGSTAHAEATSSYLGELGAVQWACKKTKALRGEVPTIVRTDSQALIDRWKAKSMKDTDVRALRRWSWIISNEPHIDFEFIPGAKNKGADLLSRPLHVGFTYGWSDEDAQAAEKVWNEHIRGHWHTMDPITI
ncbi:hypothetical protein BSKO_02216 [Bryopsis sp. KO-2023]|nr:hypothetical protein BSKO_02216 [Bryopsis sp. KO-2023]